MTGGHTVDVIARRISPAEARAVCLVLASVEHLAVAADLSPDGKLVYLRPLGDESTWAEVTAFRAFAAVTDAELRWRPAATA